MEATAQITLHPASKPFELSETTFNKIEKNTQIKLHLLLCNINCHEVNPPRGNYKNQPLRSVQLLKSKQNITTTEYPNKTAHQSNVLVQFSKENTHHINISIIPVQRQTCPSLLQGSLLPFIHRYTLALTRIRNLQNCCINTRMCNSTLLLQQANIINTIMLYQIPQQVGHHSVGSKTTAASV